MRHLRSIIKLLWIGETGLHSHIVRVRRVILQFLVEFENKVVKAEAENILNYRITGLGAKRLLNVFLLSLERGEWYY